MTKEPAFKNENPRAKYQWYTHAQREKEAHIQSPGLLPSPSQKCPERQAWRPCLPFPASLVQQILYYISAMKNILEELTYSTYLSKLKHCTFAQATPFLFTALCNFLPQNINNLLGLQLPQNQQHTPFTRASELVSATSCKWSCWFPALEDLAWRKLGSWSCLRPGCRRCQCQFNCPLLPLVPFFPYSSIYQTT